MTVIWTYGRTVVACFFLLRIMFLPSLVIIIIIIIVIIIIIIIIIIMIAYVPSLQWGELAVRDKVSLVGLSIAELLTNSCGRTFCAEL